MEMRTERLIAAVPARVMRALTDPDQLSRWACEEAIIDGATYRLTGPTLPGGGMGGALTERSDSALRFRWPLPGGESEVLIMVSAEHQAPNPPADFARVRIVHTSIPENALPEAKWQAESWECIWTLWLRQLQLWVERAEAPGRFDYTAPASLPVVERHLTMDAAPERIWRAMIDPALRSRWLTVELGEEVRRTEGREVAFRFSLGGPETTVIWILEPVAGGCKTLVIIREEGITEGAWDNQLGWHDYLVALYQETARPLIRQTVWIKAAPERVWPHVSTQEGLRRWFSTNIRFEPRVGGAWETEAHGGRLTGRVTEVDPPHRLAFTWTEPGMGWPEPEPLLLTLELTPEDGGTRVVLTHAGFEHLPEAIRTREFGGYQRGWSPGDSLVDLKAIVEGEASGMQMKFDHVAIPVRNMEAAIAFYTEKLGMRVTQTYGTVTFLACEGEEVSRLALRTREEPIIGNGWVCFDVKDAKAVRAQLAERGAQLDGDLYEIPTVGWGIDVRDPDGHMISFVDSSAMQ